MTITYRIRFRDRVALNAYGLPRNPFIFFLNAGLFLFLTFQLSVPAFRAQPPDQPLAVRVIVFAIVECVLAAIIIGFCAVAVILTLISRRNKKFYSQRTLTLGDDAFVSESEYSRSETKWSLVQKLVRTRNHIFIFLSGQNAVIVPRSPFESREQWDEFYETCKRNKSRVS